jgi:hypothetical protein
MVLDGEIEYGEVQFYFLQFTNDGPDDLETITAHALISVYSRPIQHLLVESSNTLWACQYTGVDNLRVVPLSSIVACVSVQRLPQLPDDPSGLWFVLEKSGLEDVQLTAFEESVGDEPGAGEEM